MWPPGPDHFSPRGIIWTHLAEVHKLMLLTNYQSSRHRGFREDFLKVSSWKSIFSQCDLDMQGTKTIWTLFKEGYIRIVPIKFGQNPASSLGEVALWSNCWQRTTHDWRQTFNDQNSSPWANGTLKLMAIHLSNQIRYRLPKMSITICRTIRQHF